MLLLICLLLSAFIYGFTLEGLFFGLGAWALIKVIIIMIFLTWE